MAGKMFESGALPVLERMVQFTESRHKLISHNIANVSNPYFKTVDVDPASFQAQLAEAVAERRASSATSQKLNFKNTHRVEFHENGLHLTPAPTNDGVMFHDENNRDTVKLMQNLTENAMTHRMGLDLIKNSMELLRQAIKDSR